MSNVDSFIDEVTEEVRKDRVYRLFRRYGWIGVLAVLGIVGGAAWSEWRQARETAAAQATGDAILAALESEEGAARAEALLSVEAGASARAVAAFLAAAEQERTGAPEAAAATLEAIAAEPGLTALYRDLALLKAVLLRGETLDPAARRAALEPLAVPGAPYRTLALEQLALADLAAGEIGAARDRLAALAEDAETSEALRDRVESLMLTLGDAATE